MRTIATILLIFLAQCTYLHAELIANENPTSQINVGIQNSCDSGVKSVFFLRYNNHDESIINVKNDDQICSDLDSSNRVIIIVHGFVSAANQSQIKQLALDCKQEGYNVFMVDWSQAACTDLIEYVFAVNNTREVGRHIASRLIDPLVKQCHVPLKNIILIGHSLGAHVSGFAGKEVQKLDLGTIPLIIAADPAGPLFSSKTCKNRLCISDALNVKVLHTSILGMWKPRGHLDLYFNGGTRQPGCVIIDVPCSHSKSISYMSDMMKNHCGFPGVPLKKHSDLPSYPDSKTTDCIVVDSNLLFSPEVVRGKYYVFVDDNYNHCTSNKILNCKQ